MSTFRVRHEQVGAQTIGSAAIPPNTIAYVSETEWYAASPTIRGYFTVLGGEGAAPVTTNVTSSATNVTILNGRDNRRGVTIYNDSTAILYLKFGALASTTSFTIAVAANGGYYEIPFNYTGRIDGVWASANGFARVTEIV